MYSASLTSIIASIQDLSVVTTAGIPGHAACTLRELDRVSLQVNAGELLLLADAEGGMLAHSVLRAFHERPAGDAVRYLASDVSIRKGRVAPGVLARWVTVRSLAQYARLQDARGRTAFGRPPESSRVREQSPFRTERSLVLLQEDGRLTANHDETDGDAWLNQVCANGGAVVVASSLRTLEHCRYSYSAYGDHDAPDNHDSRAPQGLDSDHSHAGEPRIARRTRLAEPQLREHYGEFASSLRVVVIAHGSLQQPRLHDTPGFV